MRSRFTEYAASSGKQAGTPCTASSSNPWNDSYIIHDVSVPPGRGILGHGQPGSITLTDSLGGSVTIPLTVNHQVLVEWRRATRRRPIVRGNSEPPTRSLTRTSTDQEATLLGLLVLLHVRSSTGTCHVFLYSSRRLRAASFADRAGTTHIAVAPPAQAAGSWSLPVQLPGLCGSGRYLFKR